MLTTEPGPNIPPYHDRQIVVLTPPDYGRWLDQAIPSAELCRPMPAGRLAIERVADAGSSALPPPPKAYIEVRAGENAILIDASGGRYGFVDAATLYDVDRPAYSRHGATESVVLPLVIGNDV